MQQAPANPKRQAAVIFILITVLIDVVGFGILIPVLPKLIQQLIHADLSTASRYGGWLMFTYAAVQFICAPIVGALSDQYGRRTVVLFCLFGFTLDYLLMGFAPTIAWLFVGRFIAGIMGASFTAASAYIADISSPEDRPKNFGMIGAAFGVGFIIGPMLGGWLGSYGLRVPFFVSAVLTLVNFLYGFYILPESLKPENRRAFDWRRANPLGTLLQLRRYPVVVALYTAMLFMYIGSHAYQTNWSYYTMFKFGWDEAAVGMSLGFVGLMFAIVQGGLAGRVVPAMGYKRSVLVGASIGVVALLGFGLASQGWMMYVVTCVFVCGAIVQPAVQSIAISQVPANAQGELQGANTSLMALGAVIGPPLMTNIFSYYTSGQAPILLPGAAFYMAALLYLISLGIMVYALYHYKR